MQLRKQIEEKAKALIKEKLSNSVIERMIFRHSVQLVQKMKKHYSHRVVSRSIVKPFPEDFAKNLVAAMDAASEVVLQEEDGAIRALEKSVLARICENGLQGREAGKIFAQNSVIGVKEVQRLASQDKNAMIRRITGTFTQAAVRSSVQSKKEAKIFFRELKAGALAAYFAAKEIKILRMGHFEYLCLQQDKIL